MPKLFCIITYMEMLENLSPLLKTFWFVAIPASLIFIIQTIMTFIGVAHADLVIPTSMAIWMVLMRHFSFFPSVIS